MSLNLKIHDLFKCLQAEQTNFPNTWMFKIIQRWIGIHMKENNLLYYLHPRYTAKITLYLHKIKLREL